MKTCSECLHQYRIPLVFLEACQSTRAEVKPVASVAAALLEGGAVSVLAMTHSVLVETATRFVECFYKSIVKGATVGKAVLDARLALALDTNRGKIFGAGNLNLRDWFVPVLYQDADDPRLFTRVPAKQEAYHIRNKQTRSFGDIAAHIKNRNHRFVGRSRELLSLERLLAREPYAVILGQGGAGKTTLALEGTHWLVRSGRFKKGAFLCAEHLVEIRSLVNDLGRQLCPSYNIGAYDTLEKALQPIRLALQESPVIIVVDNIESLMPGQPGNENDPAVEKDLEEVCDFCTALLDSAEGTRIVFTSRTKLSSPFGGNQLLLGQLSKTAAIELVSDILKQNGRPVPESDTGETPEEIGELVEAVNCHARALVLLTNEVAARGVGTAVKNIRRLMADMEKKFPGDRERSLYASLELSLQRLPQTAQDQLKKLALFHGGVQLGVLARLLHIEPEAAYSLGSQLIAVGLGEDKGYNHISLDPALPAYMLTLVEETEFVQWQEEWAGVMRQLTDYLYGQQFEDAQIAAQLTILELPNLMTMLDYIEDRFSPEEVSNTATSIEQLIADLHRPKALQKVVSIREKVGMKLKTWSPAAFVAERMVIERALSRGDLRAAFEAAQKLLERSMREGEQAYKGANSDIARAHALVGRILRLGGSPDQALPFLEQAQKGFQALFAAGNESVERMVSLTLTEKADCLMALGRLDASVAAYEEGMEISERGGDKRQVAVIKAQLGTVRMYQQKYEEAIAHYTKAKELFQQLEEYKSVAAMFHQIGMVYEKTGNFKEAERAYKESLALKIKINDKAGEASTLGQLGNLYDKYYYFEEAVTFCRQACDIYVALKDQQNEGRTRSNLADTLIKLKRFDQAREEVLKAIECDSHFGHAAEPWNAFGILYNLETATGNKEAAGKSWHKAFAAYLGYRKDGGYGQSGSAQVTAMFLEGIKSGNISELEAYIAQVKKGEVAEDDRLFFTKLESVLEGCRDLSIAGDTGLFFMDAVELYLLVEGLL